MRTQTDSAPDGASGAEPAGTAGRSGNGLAAWNGWSRRRAEMPVPHGRVKRRTFDAPVRCVKLCNLDKAER